MDEALTEDEFYAGPLRGVLSKLRRMQILMNVQTLVLDGLASVTIDLINEIVTSKDYNIRLLSIRRCLNVNQSKLQQLLSYICRPTRPEGIPRLQGIYVFTDPIPQLPSIDNIGVTMTDGAQLGAVPIEKGSLVNLAESWYAPNGQILKYGHKQRSSWEETLQICRGIIWFDAVPCTHMHAAMSNVLHDSPRRDELNDKPGVSTIATIALGPDGCTGCGRAPEGAPFWGQSDFSDFPLMWPPPHSGKLVDAIRPPARYHAATGELRQRLIVACSWCMDNRYCESCHKWWCADCYCSKKNTGFQTLEQLREVGMDMYLSGKELVGANPGNNVKVFNGFCVDSCLVGEWMAGAGGGGMWG